MPYISHELPILPSYINLKIIFFPFLSKKSSVSLEKQNRKPTYAFSSVISLPEIIKIKWIYCRFRFISMMCFLEAYGFCGNQANQKRFLSYGLWLK